MKIKKIEIEKNFCIGCGGCIIIAEKAFEIKEGKASVKKDWQKESQENIVSAQSVCPAGAIIILDEAS